MFRCLRLNVYFLFLLKNYRLHNHKTSHTFLFLLSFCEVKQVNWIKNLNTSVINEMLNDYIGEIYLLKIKIYKFLLTREVIVTCGTLSRQKRSVKILLANRARNKCTRCWRLRRRFAEYSDFIYIAEHKSMLFLYIWNLPLESWVGNRATSLVQL